MTRLSSPSDLSAERNSSTVQYTRTLVEAELVSSVAWLINLRWFAGIGVILATWAAENIFGLETAKVSLYLIGSAILLYNLVFFLIERQLTKNNAPVISYDLVAKWQVVLDWIAMILLIQFSGGIESPVILFFIFHIIITSFFFSQRLAMGFALAAIGLVAGMALLEYYNILKHNPIGGLLGSPFYQNEKYVTAYIIFFAFTALISAYLGSTINDRLRKREEEIVELSKDLQRATIRLQALNNNARTVSSTLDLKQVLNLLVSTTALAMQVRACTIRLIDSTGRSLEPVAVYGLSETYLSKGPIDPLTNLLAREVLSGRIVTVPDALESPLLQYPEEAKQEGIRSMISAPLTGKDGAFGIIRAYAVEVSRFSKEDEDFFGAIAAQGSIAIENALSYKAIEELDQTKSQFIRTITHELRSPVAVTQSLLRTLVSGFAGQLTDQQIDILKRAAHRVEFLQKLIDDLLDLATGKADVKALKQREPVGLKSSLQKVVERFIVSAHEKNIHLEQIYPTSPEEFIIMATPDGIDRIYNNLVSNAIKYTPSGGEVSTKLESVDSEAIITIADTGIGIPQESMPHLFEEFYRAPNAKEIEREGTGLGLTIVKDLVTRYGGRIAVQSVENQGTTFILSFPLYTGTRTVSKSESMP